jgi:Domain of unknown function (DUF3850)
MTAEKPKKAPVLSLPKSKRGGKNEAPETADEELTRTIRENIAASSLANKNDPPATQEAAQTTLLTIEPKEPPSMSTQDSGEHSKPPRNIHTVKMSEDFFEAYRTKKRNAQIRNNDRQYQEGDLLIVQEYSDLLMIKTSREFIAVITNISNPPGLQTGHVLMHTKHLT